MLEQMREFGLQMVIDGFESATRDADRIQRETLRRILDENAKAEYLQRFGLEGRTDPESFKALVPLITHKDIEPCIRRIMDGEDSPILTGKPITSISLSSGTTQGCPKFVPFNDELVRSTMQIYKTSFAFRNKKYPVEDGKALQFIYGSRQFQTKGGLTAATATTNVYRSKEFKRTMKDIQYQCCSPDEVIFGTEFHQSLYCHFLCGLIYSDEVQVVSSTFAHSLVHAFRTFEQIWEELCSDIREGVLSSRITVPSIRAAVSKILSPNPRLADSIHDKCAGLSNWYGVIPALWPNAKYIYGILTGSMEPYLKKLRHYAGNLPLMSSDYGASEGWIGANVNPGLSPELATFAVLPDIAYFEFIPRRQRPDHSQDLQKSVPMINHKELEPVGLTEVEVGKEYEVVITTFAGLYRYQLGDVVKVSGFHNSTPELQFVCRSNLLLNINIDKNTEKDLQIAVEEAGKLLAAEKTDVMDFTSHVDFSTDPAHYVIFWELSSDLADDEVLNSCCDCLDRAFVDAGYIASRKVRTIGPLELRILRRGTFQKILYHYLSLGTTVSQFKTPRCVGPSNSKVLQILSSSVVGSYFSTAYD